MPVYGRSKYLRRTGGSARGMRMIAALTAGERNHRWQLFAQRPMIRITDAHRRGSSRRARAIAITGGRI
jgi:hypothetical protein